MVNHGKRRSQLGTHLQKHLFWKKLEVVSTYCDIIEDYLKKGYVQKVTKTDVGQWFLPHFAVVNSEKTTSKVRVVFDAAAKLNGKSLTDTIHPGPKL